MTHKKSTNAPGKDNIIPNLLFDILMKKPLLEAFALYLTF